MATERTHTVRAAAFALVFNDVDPSFVERSVKERSVFVAERFQGFFHHIACLFVRNGDIRALYHRAMQIPHIKGFDAENLLSESDVLVHIAAVVIDGFDKVFVSLYVDVSPGKRAFERRRKSAHFSEKPVFFDAARIQGRDCVDMVFICVEHAFKSLLSDALVGILQ